MNVFDHLFSALLVLLISRDLHLLDLAHTLARIDDLERPLRNTLPGTPHIGSFLRAVMCTLSIYRAKIASRRNIL
jgi:hypothetical protein